MRTRRGIALGALLIALLGASWVSQPGVGHAAQSSVALHGQRLLYQTNWKHGLAGWDIVAGPWTIAGGQLVTDPDMYENAEILAPKTTRNLSNYAIQTRVMVANTTGNNASFGIVLRASSGESCTGIRVGFQYWWNWGDMVPSLGVWPGCATTAPIRKQDFGVDNGWHTLRVNVQGSNISVYVDGQYRMSVTTNTGITESAVGLASAGIGLDVKVFKLFAT